MLAALFSRPCGHHGSAARMPIVFEHAIFVFESASVRSRDDDAGLRNSVYYGFSRESKQL